MGYPTLDSALAFPGNLPPAGSHIVITDTLKSNANFLIHHFVGNHLKRGHAVILAGLAQIFNHYFLINRKLGINLQNFKQSGQFVYLDGLTHLQPYSRDSPYPPAGAPTTPTDTVDGSKQETDILRSFYSIICRHVRNKSRPLVVLDDASVLLLSGFGFSPACHFIQKLKAMVESVQGTLVTLIHADEQGAEDQEQDAFVRTVLSSAHFVLQVEHLSSGLARDVHGQLSILYGAQYIPEPSNRTRTQALHYRILDNNAEFFARGISRGVL